MSEISILIEPMLAHAKFYEELAQQCSDEKRALEFRQYSQKCMEAASTAAALVATTPQLLISRSPQMSSAGQMLQ
jgi:hypothetical protein